MTCNRLILLCQIYRGSLDDEMKIGTRKRDIQYLIKRKLIAYSFDNESGIEYLNVTNMGYKFVQALLVIGSFV